MSHTYKKLTTDQITQLEAQAGNEAAKLIDDLLDKSVDPDLIQSAVNDWLDDHPEATTTVQDGSITKAKLATALQTAIDSIPAVDDTLATTGAAADAKATGDAIAAMESAIPTVDDTLATAGAAADAKATGDGISGFKSQVTNEDIERQNSLKLTTKSRNLFNFNSPFNVDGYLTATGNVTASSSYRTSHFIAVDPNTLYYVLGYTSDYTSAKFVAEYDASQTFIQLSTDVDTSFTTAATTRFVRFTYNSAFAESRVGLSLFPFANKIADAYAPLVLQNKIDDASFKPKQFTSSLATLTGTNWLSGFRPFANSPRKNQCVSFSAQVTSFGNGIEIAVARKADEAARNMFKIDGTNLTVKNYDGTTVGTYPHGLTIENNLQVLIEQTFFQNVTVTVVSNGSSFKQTGLRFDQASNGFWYVQDRGASLANVRLTWTSKDIAKAVWMFGDSYFGYSDRWPYYLNQYGYADNVLMDAFPGKDSAEALVALESYLLISVPKTVVWCTGMNDGSDTGTTPSASWKTGIDKLLELSKQYQFDVVLATIPTVPTVNNEAKNTWVRNSGHQYIDFALAVGAQSDGTWYSGMLDDDEVHPTGTGAMALFMQVLADFPQIMIDH